MARLKAQQRREQLMEVAAKLFSRRGYDATTTAAIAEAAGVTEPILYRHFKNKQELFVCIIRHTSQAQIARWRKVIDGAEDPAEQIRLVIEEFSSRLARLPDEDRLMNGALVFLRDRKVMAAMRQHFVEVEAFFLQLLRDGQRIGVFRADLDPKLAVWTLINTGLGIEITSDALPNLGVPAPEAGEFLLNSMLAKP